MPDLPEDDPDRLVSTHAAAEFLDLAEDTLHRLRRKGHGPSFVVINERRIGYRMGALREYVRSREVQRSPKAVTS